jgi:hypothetical protein
MNDRKNRSLSLTSLIFISISPQIIVIWVYINRVITIYNCGFLHNKINTQRTKSFVKGTYKFKKISFRLGYKANETTLMSTPPSHPNMLLLPKAKQFW